MSFGEVVLDRQQLRHETHFLMRGFDGLTDLFAIARPINLLEQVIEGPRRAPLTFKTSAQVPGGKFRVLERHQFRGMDFAAQAETIRQVTRRYWVTYIGIDTTGLGSAVAQLVRQFFPALRTFSYSPEVKSRLVMKAWDVISKGRLEFDAGWTDLAQSLMAIRKTVTAGGRQFTYTAGRTDNTGHADLAWALFHALHNEPLEGQTVANTGLMEFF